MIYLFDDTKTLIGTVRPKHTIALLYERERNGLYTVSTEFPVKYNERGTIYNYYKKANKADFLGHYDREGRFQLHKIAAVEVDGSNVLVKGIHIFFDEAKAGAIIREKRYRGRSANIGASEMLLEIGWNLVDYDPSPPKDYSFYNVSPLEARQIILDKFAMEFDYWLDFDGKKVTNKQVALKTAIGEKTSKRYTYGSNVLSIRAEQDYSEVYTAVIGRGRGEEYEDTGGYGRRIEFTDVTWRKPNNPLDKPSGERILIDPAATQLFGYKEDGTVRPRVKVEVFSDIEDPTQLLNESYAWLMENNTPKAVFSVDVADGDGLNLGDEVYVIYRDIDLVKPARVSKVIDDLISGDRDVEFGDVAYFNTDRRLSGIDAKLSRVENESASVIYRMKLAFDERFDEQVKAIEDAYEQAVIDANANIQAAEVRMTEEIEGQRTEIMQEVESSKQEAIKQAESDAKAKADSVQSNLDSFKDVHQRLYDDVTADVLDINEFLGEKDFSLDWHLNSLREEMQDQINAVNSANPNLIVGSTLEQFTDFEDYGVGQSQIHKEESMNYIRTTPVGETSKIFGYLFPSTVHLEQGSSYTLGIDFRSESVEDLDYIYFMGPHSNVALSPVSQTRGLTADGTWNRYYFKFDWVDSTRDARLLIATNTNYGDADYGWFDTRRAMLYEGSLEVPWSPSPSDNSQIITQLSRKISELEDGLKSKATKTEFDLLSGDFTQFTNEFTTTAERLESELQEHDNWLNSNGSNLLQMADRVQSKVWLNDFSEVNPNLIPFADVSDSNNLFEWKMWNANANAVDSYGEYVVRSTSSSSVIGIQSQTFDVKEGEPLVLSAITRTSDRWQTDPNFAYTYLMNENGTDQFLGSAQEYQQMDASRRRNVWKFTADFTGSARVLIGTYTLNEGVDARFTFKEPKLERGTERTPYMNAFSNVEQLANSLKLQVQELDGTFLSQSDIQINPGYVQLGSQRLGDSQLASILKVSPESIDVITDEMNLTGNLNVKGQIESISMSAVEAEFADLFAAQVRAGTIDVEYINGLTAEFERMYTLNANIERLVAQHVFTDAVHAKSLDAIYADLRSVNSEIMDTNILKANWIQGGQALFDKVFINNAMVERLTSKTVFARDVQSITIDAVQANIQTVMNSMGQVEGGLTIRRPDGAVWVQNGQARGHMPVQVYDTYSQDEVGFTGLNFYTGSSHWQSFKYFYTPHEGTRLRVTWAVGLYDGPSTVEYMEVRVRTFSGYSPINMGIGTSVRRETITKGETTYITQDIPMPPPEYREMAAYLEFRRAPDGQSNRNRVYARLLFIGQFE